MSGGLYEFEKRTLECKSCNKRDELYRDAHGIFCKRCGPNVPVVFRSLYPSTQPKAESE
ncbi:hypothetical protein R2A130_3514 [Ahrensia sp. R2A130]|nr:hypothetical protein R2A130_3514 [Ahrensia sp. R2A130]